MSFHILLLLLLEMKQQLEKNRENLDKANKKSLELDNFKEVVNDIIRFKTYIN